MRYVLINIFILVSSGIWAQLTVTVNDAHTAQAVEGAHVSLLTSDNKTLYAVSNAEGKAYFKKPGLSVKVQHISYVSQHQEVKGKKELTVFISPEK